MITPYLIGYKMADLVAQRNAVLSIYLGALPQIFQCLFGEP